MIDAAIFADASSIFKAPSPHAAVPHIAGTESRHPRAAVLNNIILAFLTNRPNSSQITEYLLTASIGE